MKNKIKVIIVGGGFGGVYSAKNLLKYFNHDEIEITLINKGNFFLFTPLLHEVATGALTPDSIVEPIREVFRNTPINFLEDSAIEIDKDTKQVITTKEKLKYDYLIIASGAVTNYMNVPGANEFTFTLKNLQDAIAIRNHILNTCENAYKTNNKDLLTFSVIGAGPTGVELATELIEYIEHTICSYYKSSVLKKEDIKVNLISAGADIIPQFPVEMRQIALKEVLRKGINVLTNTIINKVEPGLMYTKDGNTIKSNTIIWVAGVKPNANEIKGIVVGEKGRINTSKYLMSDFDESIFALGDSSGNLPMLAQVAVVQAQVIAENIYKLSKNADRSKLTEFNFKEKGLLISLGQWYALGNFYGVTFSGKIMWWVWRTVYLINFLSWRKRVEIAIEWTIDLFYPRDITVIK